jgi:flavin-dependent dehydrogenase
MTAASKISVIGGGPAGAFAASLLASAGNDVSLFDEKLAWEKPCGGGLTAKALDRYPFLRDNKYPKKFVSHAEMSVRGGPSVRFELRDPICIYSRQTLNQMLLDRAEAAGVRVVQERITAIEPGARNPFSGFGLPQSQADTSMTLGYFVPGAREVMEIEFQDDLEGYLWIFPRDTHSSVGICGTLLREPSARMKQRLHDYMRRKSLPTAGARFYSHRLPALKRESLHSVCPAGAGWAAVGDAAGFVDPITGEGLYYALRSAELLAECHAGGRLADYPRLLRKDFLHDLELGARIASRFYHGQFLGGAVTTRMIQFAARSATFANLVQDLFAGSQGYLGLKQRLMRQLNRTLGEIAASFFLPVKR